MCVYYYYVIMCFIVGKNQRKLIVMLSHGFDVKEGKYVSCVFFKHNYIYFGSFKRRLDKFMDEDDRWKYCRQSCSRRDCHEFV